MHTSRAVCAQIGRLRTPAPEVLGGTVEDKAKDFFREVCRFVPWAVKNYKLDELTTPKSLRSNLSLMFREYAHIKDPRVVDILIYKGREELEIADFLRAPETRRAELASHTGSQVSAFLQSFYRNTG